MKIDLNFEQRSLCQACGARALKPSVLKNRAYSIRVSSVFHLWLKKQSILNPCFIRVSSVALLFLLCGCREREAEVSSVVLATVGGKAITQGDFDREAAMRPGKSAEEVMGELIKHRALYSAAEASGVMESPVLKRDLENRVISEWLETAFRRERDAMTVTEAEIRAAYEEKTESLVKHPAQARFAILYQKGRNVAELTETLSEAVAAFKDDTATATNNQRLPGFGKVAAEYSEDTVSRYKGGDIGWVGEGNASRIPDEVLAAGNALGVGDLSEPMAAGDGVYVIMKTDDRPLARVSFNEAAPGLRRRLLLAKQSEFEAQFMATVTGGVAIVRKAAPKETRDQRPETSQEQPPRNPF